MIVKTIIQKIAITEERPTDNNGNKMVLFDKTFGCYYHTRTNCSVLLKMSKSGFTYDWVRKEELQKLTSSNKTIKPCKTCCINNLQKGLIE